MCCRCLSFVCYTLFMLLSTNCFDFRLEGSRGGQGSVCQDMVQVSCRKTPMGSRTASVRWFKRPKNSRRKTPMGSRTARA